MSKKNENENQKPQTEQPAGEQKAESTRAAKPETEQKAEPAKSEKPKKAQTPLDPDRAAKKLGKRKRLKYGSLATAATIIFIAIVVVMNYVVSAVVDRYPLKLDLTTDQLYEISEDSINYVKGLEKDVDIIVLAKESYFTTDSTMKMVSETLDKYRQNASKHISVDYVDMTENPEYATKYSASYSGELAEGDIVVTCGDRVKVVAFENVIKVEQSYDQQTGMPVNSYSFVGEQSLTAAIMNVTDANAKTVGIIATVNGEAIYHSSAKYGVDTLQTMLENNGYNVETLDLFTGTLDPEKYDMVVLPAPMNDLTDTMIDRLEAYLYHDGKLGTDLLYMASAYQYATPNLDAFLETWGVKIENSIIYEGDSSVAQVVSTVLGNVEAPAASVADETYGAPSAGDKKPIVAPLSRPITLLFDANTDRKTKALLTSAKTAYLYPLDIRAAGEETTEATEETSFDQSQAETGVQNFLTVSTKTSSTSSEDLTNDVMVIGSVFFTDYQLNQSSSYKNRAFLIGAINTMQGKEESVIIEPKAIAQSTMTITQAQATGVRTFVVVILPGLIVAAGIVVYIRRKNR